MKLSSVFAVVAALAVDASVVPQSAELRARSPAPVESTRSGSGFASFTSSSLASGVRSVLPSSSPSLRSTPTSANQTNSTILSTSGDAWSNSSAVNSPSHRGNWLTGFDINTDYTQQWPGTNKTVRKTWTIVNTTFAPDGGVPQPVLLVNGQYPGPLLEANWGDNIEITVVNQLQHNGTGIHWHGIRQLNNNPNDGAGGVTECPIPPGGQKVYQWQATGYGSSWYHAQYSTQSGAGVVGPIIIHGPASANYDIDLGHVMVSDLYPFTSYQEEWFSSRLGPPTASNYIVNGRNVRADGSIGQDRTTFDFTPGKKHLLRFINHGLDHHFKVSIDGHSLLVIAADNTPIVPYKISSISLGIGQRYDVIVTADQPSANYYLRTIPSTDCSRNANNGLGIANAMIIYDEPVLSLPSALPTALPSPDPVIHAHTPHCTDEPLPSLIPIVSQTINTTFSDFSNFLITLTPTISTTSPATLNTQPNPNTIPSISTSPPSTNDTLLPTFHWSLLPPNTQAIDYSHPVLSSIALSATIASNPNASSLLPASWSTVTLPDNLFGSYQFILLQNPFHVSHPMHLHGHSFSVLGSGSGDFSVDDDYEGLNFDNPMRRDTVMLPASGWLVIAFKVDNPGAWLMQCGVAWHASQGLGVTFLEMPGRMRGLYEEEVGGSEWENTCRGWQRWVADGERNAEGLVSEV